ncbi:MAG: hypothetical protein V3S83_12395 [Gemmatimonadota bacterium]
MSDCTLPIWAIFCKLKVRTSGAHLRVALEVPTGRAAAAKRLKKLLGAGRVEDGTFVVEGRQLPRAMTEFGFPGAMVLIVRQIWDLRGTPGIPMDPDAIVARGALVADLKAVASTALRVLRL